MLCSRQSGSYVWMFKMDENLHPNMEFLLHLNSNFETWDGNLRDSLRFGNFGRHFLYWCNTIKHSWSWKCPKHGHIHCVDLMWSLFSSYQLSCKGLQIWDGFCIIHVLMVAHVIHHMANESLAGEIKTNILMTACS